MGQTLNQILKINSITFLLYYLSAVMGIKFISLPPGNLTVIWLPAGIALGCVMIFGKKIIPAIFLGSFLSNTPFFVTDSNSISLIKGLSTGAWLASIDTLQPLIGFYFYQRFVRTYIFANRKNVLKYYFYMVLLPPVLTTWAIVLSPHLLGYSNSNSTELLFKILTVTLADILGIVLVTPLFFTPRITKFNLKDIFLLLGFILLLVSNIYCGIHNYSVLTYLAIPILTLLIVRFKNLGYSLGLMIFSFYSIYTITIGVGPFYSKNYHLSFINLFAFIISIALPLSYIFSLINELRFSNSQLKDKNTDLKDLSLNLERIVEQRTKDLRIAKEEADLANQAKSAFLSNMSHEIRTPMNAIIGFVDILGENETDDEKKSYLDIVKTSSKNLLAIINDILDLSKIEAGKITVSHEPINLNDFAQNISKGFMEQAKMKGLEFIFECESNLKTEILSDEKILSQILNNLLSNAVKFTSAGSVKLQIKTTPDKQLAITVSDTGIGISLQKQERIFEAFYQGDNSMSKKYGGTGLGLPILKKSVDLLNGTISVHTEEGKGTTFLLLIPFQLADIIENPEKIRFNNPADEPEEKYIKIISAEDVEINQILLEKIIKGQNWELKKVYNGIELIEELGKQTYDIILLDVQMPEMNGIEAAKIIKNTPQLANIPIIALTAYAFDEDLKEIIQTGVNDYITKPIKKDVLLRKIRQWAL